MIRQFPKRTKVTIRYKGKHSNESRKCIFKQDVTLLFSKPSKQQSLRIRIPSVTYTMRSDHLRSCVN